MAAESTNALKCRSFESPTPSSLYEQIYLRFSVNAGTDSIKVAYQIGSVAPADCNSGTAVSVGSVSSYAITGLAAQQTVSVRVCGVSSAGMSGGVTGTITTRATGNSYRVFTTASSGMGSWVGTESNADNICNAEGRAAFGTNTVWKAVIFNINE